MALTHDELQKVLEFDKALEEATHVGVDGEVKTIILTNRIDDNFNFSDEIGEGKSIHDVPLDKLVELELLDRSDLDCCYLNYTDNGFDEYAEDTCFSYEDMLRYPVELYKLKEIFSK